MKSIRLKGEDIDVTVISNYFLDHYMIKANGEYVKVYLYILRCLLGKNKEISVCYLADVLDHTEKDIVRAIKYWEAQGIFIVTYKNEDIESISINTLVNTKVEESVSVTRESAATISVEKDNVIEEAKNIVSKADKKEISKERLTELMSDEDVKMLLYMIQKYLEKTLNTSDTNTILYFYNELEFSAELIEYLVEYCVSNNHKSFRYIEKVALNWHSENVKTVEDAKRYTSEFSNNCYPVLNAFGLSGRNPAAVEKAFIIKWIDEYGFDMDLIIDACNRTIEAIHKPSFQYADSILQRWMKKGVKSINDLKVIDDEHEKNKEVKNTKVQQKAATPKTAFNNFQQRTYDYDAMERILLQRK